jgi:hypothetical protein
MPQADRPEGINLTHEIFSRMQDAAPELPVGVRQLFRTGAQLDSSYQESLLTIMLPHLRAAAQTRARSAKQRGLVVIDQRASGEIWYLAESQAHAAFAVLPADLWSHVAQVLRTYNPLKEVVAIRLHGRTLEVMYFDRYDAVNTQGTAPIPIPRLPDPLARERLPAFTLPLDVTMRREGSAYVFTHHTLGLLGQLELKGLGPGQTQITGMVAGHPDDPMTAQRQAILEPLTAEISRRLELGLGLDDPGPAGASAPLPPDTPPIIETPRRTPLRTATTIHPCAVCGKDMLFLIFADDPATTLEDYARLMFEVIREQNLITYVLGTPERHGSRPLDGCPSALLKVWPTREAVRMVTPPEFDALLLRLSQQHPHHKGRRQAGKGGG